MGYVLLYYRRINYKLKLAIPHLQLHTRDKRLPPNENSRLLFTPIGKKYVFKKERNLIIQWFREGWDRQTKLDTNYLIRTI